MPSFRVNDTTSVYYSVGQNLYTPEDIRAPSPDPLDRPYAAFLYGSAGFTSITDNHIDDLELTLGVVGPLAFGEQTQKQVHEWVGSPEPQGWDFQLENEPGLILSWQRSWPEAFAATPGPLHMRVTPHVGTTLGNVYTYANVGPDPAAAAGRRPLADPAAEGCARRSPAAASSRPPSNAWAWSVFAGVEGRAVGRNIFLDGNSFRDSRSVDRRYFVADASAGLSLTYGAARISYTFNWRSREFDRQDDPSIFGAIAVGYRF